MLFRNHKYATKHLRSHRDRRAPQDHHHGPRRYRKYYHQQPEELVYVEEPTDNSESESSSSEEEQARYEFDLSSNSSSEESESESDDDFDSSRDIMIYDDLSDEDDSEDDDFDSSRDIMIYDDLSEGDVELNDSEIDDLDEEDIMRILEHEGRLVDLNDELVALYDSLLESDSTDDDDVEEDEELVDFIDLDDPTQVKVLSQFLEAASDSEFDSLDLDIEVEDQLALRYAQKDDSELLSSDDEVVFYTVDTSDSESDDDSQSESDSDDDSDSDSDMDSDSLDGEGVTIYERELPFDEELGDDNYDSDGFFVAEDSDDEYRVVDLSKDLEESKDFEVEEHDDHYKINIRLDSLITEDLRLDFNKAENELIVKGKFDFGIEDSENDDDDDLDNDEDGEPVEAIVTVAEESSSETSSLDSDLDSSSDSSSDLDSDSDLDSSSSSSSSSESDSDSSSDLSDDDEEINDEEGEEAIKDVVAEIVADALASAGKKLEEEGEDRDEQDGAEDDDEEFVDAGAVADVTCDIDDEEIKEDAQFLTKDFQTQEISFEKHFRFDKLVAFEDITAKFNNDTELEIIVPHTGLDYLKEVNYVPIAIEAGAVEDVEMTDA